MASGAMRPREDHLVNPQPPATPPDEPIVEAATEPERGPGEHQDTSMAARFLPATKAQWAALVVAGLVFAGWAGYLVRARESRPPGKSSVDVGFLYDMLDHHGQAVRMSGLQLARGAESGVATFAREILLFQAYEIGLMEQKLREWGYDPDQGPELAMGWMGTPTLEMPGMASEEEMALLSRREGRDVDALFLALMKDHHAGGVHMARFAAKGAADPLVREWAQRMTRNQAIEINELEAARERTALPDKPPGYLPSDIPSGPADADVHGGHP